MNASTSSTNLTASQPHSSQHGRVWIKRGLIGGALIIAGLGCLGAICQAISVQADLRAYQPSGQFIDLGGRRIHMLVKGQENGNPTVLLEAGIAGFSSNWGWVQDTLAQSTRVVSYDRAGLGWSDPSPEPQDAQQSAQDLHTALHKAGISGPYVIAGHSYGGLVVRAFTDLYPDEVVGMVLVDASHPNQWVHIPAARGGQTVAIANHVTGWLVNLGLTRLFNMNKAAYVGLPDQQAKEMKAILNMSKSWSTSGDVLAIWDSRTRPEIEQAHSLENLPLIVLSVTDQPASVSQVLTELQDELPYLSSNSLHITVKGATHDSLIADQEHAMQVASAIRQVIDAAETGSPLVSK